MKKPEKKKSEKEKTTEKKRKKGKKQKKNGKLSRARGTSVAPSPRATRVQSRGEEGARLIAN